MEESTHRRDEPLFDDALKKGIKWSIVFHVALVFIVVVKPVFFPDAPYIPSLRVDLVELPQILKKDLYKVKDAGTAKPKEEAKKEEIETAPEKVEPKSNEMALQKKAKKKRKKKINSALARIKALAKLETTPDERNGVQVRGNQLSPGQSTDADARESAEASYNDIVKQQIYAKWLLPSYLQNRDLKALVLIKIDARGNIVEIVFRKESNNRRFDEMVVECLNSASPITPPPDNVRDLALSKGFLLGFPE